MVVEDQRVDEVWELTCFRAEALIRMGYLERKGFNPSRETLLRGLALSRSGFEPDPSENTAAVDVLGIIYGCTRTVTLEELTPAEQAYIELTVASLTEQDFPANPPKETP